MMSIANCPVTAVIFLLEKQQYPNGYHCRTKYSQPKTVLQSKKVPE